MNVNAQEASCPSRRVQLKAGIGFILLGILIILTTPLSNNYRDHVNEMAYDSLRRVINGESEGGR
jgi:hypothetical protein